MKLKYSIIILTFLWSCDNKTNPSNPTTEVKGYCGTGAEQRTKSSLNDSLYYIAKNLFQNNCAACHGINNKVVAWPIQRIRNDYGVGWTLAFIKDNEMLKKSGDLRTLYVFDFLRGSAMPTFKHLTDNQILLILDYIDSFEYKELSNDGTVNYYEHRRLSKKAMKDSVRIALKQYGMTKKEIRKALK